MADYRLTETTMVVRNADEAWIPDDPENRDWIEYQNWLAEGNTPDPYAVPVNASLDSFDPKTIKQILGV
jgi:hypothetical protein